MAPFGGALGRSFDLRERSGDDPLRLSLISHGLQLRRKKGEHRVAHAQLDPLLLFLVRNGKDMQADKAVLDALQLSLRPNGS